MASQCPWKLLCWALCPLPFIQCFVWLAQPEVPVVPDLVSGSQEAAEGQPGLRTECFPMGRAVLGSLSSIRKHLNTKVGSPHHTRP